MDVTGIYAWFQAEPLLHTNKMVSYQKIWISIMTVKLYRV